MIRVGSDEDFRLNLPEAIQHALDSEIRRAGRKHRAQTGRGQHGNHGLRHVGQPGSHHVARRQAGVAERRRQNRDLAVQSAIREPAHGPLFAPEHHGRLVIPRAQQVLREVQAGFGKPAGAGHPVRVLDDYPAGLTDDLAEIPNQTPEQLRLID